MRASAVALFFLLLPPTILAQGTQELRFRPAQGARVQIISDTRLNTIVVGFPSMPDSTPIESTWRTIATQRVAEVRGTEWLLTARIDSSRARVRVGTDPRTEVPLPGLEGLTGRWLQNDRLVMSAIAGGQPGDSIFLDALTSNVGGFKFTLPEEPVAVGGEWSGPFRFPLGAHLSVGGKIACSGSLAGRATGLLDSLVIRGTDTLAYMTVRAVAQPTTLSIGAEGGVGTATFSGGFAARVVWSTGWNAVVAAGTNGLISGTVSVTRAEGPVNGALSITVTGRQQVRL